MTQKNLEHELERIYFETEITDSLKQNRIIENYRTPIFYKPANIGDSYRKKRQWVMKNISTIGLGGAAVAGIGIGVTALFAPLLAGSIAAGIGTAGILGYLGKSLIPLDNFLYYNPKDVAERYFKYTHVPWYEAYDNLDIKTKSQLDGFVYMAQTPSVVKRQFCHHDPQVTLGVTIAKITDFLSTLSINDGNTVSGLKLEHIIDMITRQKVGAPEDTEAIKQLSDQYSPKQLTKYLNTINHRSIPGLETLDHYTRNIEFLLRISEADNVESIGSQISKGGLMITNAVGHDTACYAGMHSKGKDFPRITIKDDVNHSLMTHAKRGLAVVGGNAQQGVLDRATGGIAIIGGTTEHNFAYHLDHSTYPGVAVCIQGMLQDPNKLKVKNGIVATLDHSMLLPEKDPAVYVFSDWEVKKHPLPNTDEAHIEAMKHIRSYVDRWKRLNTSLKAA